MWWRYHKVTAGDTLAGVAKKYHTTPNAIAQVNNLSADELEPESKLIIPVSGHKLDPASVTYARRPTHYHVRKGDTIASVADDFGVPADKIRKWNHLKGDSLHPGRTIAIYQPVSEDAPASRTANRKSSQTASKSAKSKKLQASSKGRRVHTVQAGETLFSIASHFKTTVAALKRDNPRLSAKLRPGDTVVIGEGR